MHHTNKRGKATDPVQIIIPAEVFVFELRHCCFVYREPFLKQPLAPAKMKTQNERIVFQSPFFRV